MSSGHENESPAFTLVELLTATVIIAILAALLLAAIARSKNPAKRIQCASNVRQLGLALQEFVADNHVYPLLVNVDVFKGRYPEHYRTWIDALEHEKIASQPGKSFFETGVWHCPSAQRPPNFPTNVTYMSYGYNAFGLDVVGNPVSLGLGGHKMATAPHMFAPPVNESEVVCPSDMMAIGDVFDGEAALWRDVRATNAAVARSRHQGTANVVFCDDHVESPALEFLLGDTSDAALARWNRDHLPHREKFAP
jgi:prepilin-type N-terminal cleavage/methylation domain-containing protein/prepilin-type processing-associated H-X9-DG protein